LWWGFDSSASPDVPQILDSDGDGVGDNADTFPNNATKQTEKAGLSNNGVAVIASHLLLLILRYLTK
jgi:hypothetical protein